MTTWTDPNGNTHVITAAGAHYVGGPDGTTYTEVRPAS
jgi:hypothetical protein